MYKIAVKYYLQGYYSKPTAELRCIDCDEDHDLEVLPSRHGGSTWQSHIEADNWVELSAKVKEYLEDAKNRIAYRRALSEQMPMPPSETIEI